MSQYLLNNKNGGGGGAPLPDTLSFSSSSSVSTGGSFGQARTRTHDLYIPNALILQYERIYRSDTGATVDVASMGLPETGSTRFAVSGTMFADGTGARSQSITVTLYK